jgi:hypothetical protein
MRQTKKNDVGEICSTHRTGGKFIQNFQSENLEGRDHSEDIGIDGRIILKGIFREIGWEGVDRMHLAQYRYQWQVILNAVMKLRITYEMGNFLTGEGIYFTESVLVSYFVIDRMM